MIQLRIVLSAISTMEKDKKQILGKLKLNKLSENELEKRERRILKGGSDCPDGCSPNTSISNATVDKYS